MIHKDQIVVCILFSDLDNIPTQDSSEWVDSFRRFLTPMLEQVSDKTPRIDVYSESNTDESCLLNCSVLIPIISDNFLNSEVCLKMLETFFAQEQTDKHVFKVLKSPIEIERQPDQLTGFQGYDLYKVDVESGQAYQFRDFFDFEARGNYWMKLVDLAYNIFEASYDMKEVLPINSHERKVYLAETTPDLAVLRNTVRRELMRYGFEVLPKHPLPIDEYEDALRKNLENSFFSIHLIGNSYGPPLPGVGSSAPDVQNKIAAAHFSKTEKRKGLSRLIWVSPDQQNISDQQLAFVVGLKRDISDHHEEMSEIFQTSFEEFKNFMRKELQRQSTDINPTSLDKNIRTNDALELYLIYDEIDAENIKGIATQFEEAGFNVRMPKFNEGFIPLREHHMECLHSFDVALIYQDKVNSKWVRMKLLDLLKAPGFGRPKPILGKAIMYGSSTTQVDKRIIMDQPLEVIDARNQDANKAVENFINKILATVKK